MALKIANHGWKKCQVEKYTDLRRGMHVLIYLIDKKVTFKGHTDDMRFL